MQDVIFFAEDRPVLIRLHVHVDGKPHGAAWDRYAKKLFAFLDRDGDGTLSRDEASRAPSGQQFQMMRQQGYTYGIGGAATYATFGELDADEDGKVSYDEFLAYYRRTGAAGVQITVTPPQPTAADALTDTLFRLLDADRDGKLSKEELAQAEKVLRPFDTDDNELVSASEIQPATLMTPAYAAAGMMMKPERPGPRAGSFLFLTADDSPNRLTQRLTLAQGVINRYDKDGNGTLDRREIRLDREVFKALDTNGDGELDQIELMKLLRQPPDVEAIIRLGKTGSHEEPTDLVARGGKPAALAAAVRKGTSGTLLLTLGDAEIDMRRAVGSGGDESQLKAQADQLRQGYVMQIKSADAKNKGYVEKADLRKPQFRRFEALFDLADRDGDGKLTEDELNAWFDLLEKATESYVSLVVAENGRSLFDILDANRDGSLGLRELRTAWTRLAPYDRDGDGRVARAEIPRQFQITLGLGQAPLAMRTAAPGNPAAETAAVTTRGPLWFRKMDRNGDGDVSLREFLGTREEFRKIDTDGDGLISAEEAERFDAALRKKNN